MILVLDNYDSFTFNLVQYLEELDAKIVVKRNDQITLAQIEELHPEGILISPGPGTPDESGMTLPVIGFFHTRMPILGVCLGHQALAQFFGGKIVRAERLMHGKTSPIYHDQKGVFSGLPSPFSATRYHSLIVEKGSLPSCFTQTAQTSQDEIMGIRHKEYPLEGVQFHPESFLTEHGHKMLQNWLKLLPKLGKG